MIYNEEALRRTTGQALMNNLNKAFQIFRQEERHEQQVMAQYDTLAKLDHEKFIWKMKNAARKPAIWMIAASLIVGAIILNKYIVGDGKFLMLMVLSSVSFAVFLLRFGNKPIKGNQDEFVKSFLVLEGVNILFWFVFSFLEGWQWYEWLIVIAGIISSYAVFGLVDCKFIHKEKRAEELNEHFAKIDAEAALELNKRLTTLQTFRASDQMAFAKAAVPATFHSSGTLGRLIRVMEDGAIYNLPNGIAAYQQIEHMTYMEMQAAAQARAQEAAAREQQAQTAVLRRQSADAAAHNRDMRDQARRANETLNDMRREQKEHNEKVEKFYNDTWY